MTDQLIGETANNISLFYFIRYLPVTGMFVHKHHLHHTFKARFVRLIPKSWHSWMSLRWEIYGCAVSGNTIRYYTNND